MKANAAISFKLCSLSGGYILNLILFWDYPKAGSTIADVQQIPAWFPVENALLRTLSAVLDAHRGGPQIPRVVTTSCGRQVASSSILRFQIRERRTQAGRGGVRDAGRDHRLRSPGHNQYRFGTEKRPADAGSASRPSPTIGLARRKAADRRGKRLTLWCGRHQSNAFGLPTPGKD